MFHRKRASSNPPRPVKTPPSAAASLAATQAFLANRASNGNLSSAAAAAALRSHTTSPTPVGQIQTKRMQRRGSASSIGSGPDRPGLQRKGSGGSLTERTFREQSPSRVERPASSHGPYSRFEEPPPVPALPENFALPKLVPTKAARRAASVEPPERVKSPPPRLPGGRGVSLDRGPGTYRSGEGAGSKGKLSGLTTVDEQSNRPANRGSVNFSRPMSPQNSPPISPIVGARAKPPPASNLTAAGHSNRDRERTLGSTQEVFEAPVKRKKKAVVTDLGASGKSADDTSAPYQVSLTQATTKPQSPSTSSTPLCPSPNVHPMSNGEAPKPKKKKKKAAITTSASRSQDSEGFGNAFPSDTDSVISERSSTIERPRTYNTRAAGLLMKQPSIVREDREAEEQGDARHIAQINGARSTATPANSSRVILRNPQQKTVDGQTDALQYSGQTSLDVTALPKAQSLSPARAAHFSARPEFETPDGTKHQPPARSVSPAKSALKHSPSRGASPIGAPGGHRQNLAPSETSDTGSIVSDDGSRSMAKKRKSVRVSFDDQSVVVGRAASPTNTDSPMILSPQHKPKGKSWFDLVREKKEEETMAQSGRDTSIKPTPTLPSFDSIRSRNDGSQGSNYEATKAQRSNGSLAQETLHGMTTSTDQGIGSVLTQDASTRKKRDESASNIQSGTNEPLPPEVTSVEGTGYISDEENLSLEDPHNQNMAAIDSTQQAAPTVVDRGMTTIPSIENVTFEEPETSVPSIALQPATPALETSDDSREGWLGMPGGFPGSAEAPVEPLLKSALREEHPSADAASENVGRTEDKFAPGAVLNDVGALHVGEVEPPQARFETQSVDESEDTGDSIYSDAAEDPDDLGGDGFGSINAIVESPVSPIIPRVGNSPPVSPSLKIPIARVPQPSPLGRNESETSEPASEEGWDRAQAYWSGLPQERKRQLEQAAAPGALDEFVLPNKTLRGVDSIKKKKKKKKVPKTNTAPSTSYEAPLPPWPDKQYREDITRISSPPLKSSLRNSQVENPSDTHLRSSMRVSQIENSPKPQKHSANSNAGFTKSALKAGGQVETQQLSPRPRGALQKKSRPVSAIAMVDYNKMADAEIGHARAASASGPPKSLTPVITQIKANRPAPKPRMLRNDSDSDSSFRRERSSTSGSGKYTMKRTMRPQSMDAQTQSPTARRATSMATQPTSPAGSTTRRPFSSIGPGSSMRTSLREPTESSRPAARSSLRESKDSHRTKSPSRFGFSKSKSKSGDSKSASRFSSRFGDSSDEDGSFAARLSSRFADSSDDEPDTLTPARSIPYPINEVDSTDLEDSSGEDIPAPSNIKANGTKTHVDTKPEGVALATGSLRVQSGNSPAASMGTGLQAKKAAEKEKKRSFFGSLGSKKKNDNTRGVRKADVESAARRDTPLERSKAERMMTTEPPKTNERVLAPSSPQADPVAQAARPAVGSRTSTAQGSPRSPKLQRRNTPQKLASSNGISWPLPGSPGGTMGTAPGSRPQTSDGQPAAAVGGRPEIGIRGQSEGTRSGLSAVTDGATAKKKRFPMLRKAFRIA